LSEAYDWMLRHLAERAAEAHVAERALAARRATRPAAALTPDQALLLDAVRIAAAHLALLAPTLQRQAAPPEAVVPLRPCPNETAVGPSTPGPSPPLVCGRFCGAQPNSRSFFHYFE
jgi:hypothetical protein